MRRRFVACIDNSLGYILYVPLGMCQWLRVQIDNLGHRVWDCPVLVSPSHSVIAKQLVYRSLNCTYASVVLLCACTPRQHSTLEHHTWPACSWHTELTADEHLHVPSPITASSLPRTSSSASVNYIRTLRWISGFSFFLFFFSFCTPPCNHSTASSPVPENPSPHRELQNSKYR